MEMDSTLIKTRPELRVAAAPSARFFLRREGHRDVCGDGVGVLVPRGQHSVEQLPAGLRGSVFTAIISVLKRYKELRNTLLLIQSQIFNVDYCVNVVAIPKPEDRGLRVAVLASIVSSIVIFAMSVSFIICCLQERMSRKRAERTDGRGRMRDKRQSSWRSECWLERDEGDWEAFPPPKIYNLSQQLDPRLTPETPVYMGGLAGYDNRGYQRSQENLMKAPLPGLYRTESQMYPHVVLQRVPTPTVPTAPSAPIYLRLSTPPPTESPSEQPALPPYPSATPQRLWP
ncbi:uncharacterized protein LOC143741441 [Siphateles boraxobius]|uniref:uncharacterized protein LOC143741441 n=1 Tax=Siphateles boraxobius TaxID=180520 RepID=UPI004062A186